MQPLLTQLLDLSGMDVEDYHDTGETLILAVKAHSSSGICPRCGQTSDTKSKNICDR